MTNIINEPILSTLNNEYCEIYPFIDYKIMVEDMYHAAETRVTSSRDAYGLVLKCLLSITGLHEEYKVKELLDDEDLDIFQKLPCMAHHRFYAVNVCFEAAGIVVLYPDLQTFSMLIHPYKTTREQCL